MTDDANAVLRQLPSVHELAEALGELEAAGGWPRALVVSAARAVLAEARLESRATTAAAPDIRTLAGRARARIEALTTASLRRVINATGVVLHTNLGRAPLERFRPISGYSNLEYDLVRGRRGQRDAHVGALLEEILGAPAIAVNNNAAAVYLALHELAAGYEAIVSRGELIEIGDGFRIPDILARSGAALKEVGTTNRTHLEDYRAAIGERTRLILRVHPSNFRIQGFTARPSIGELASLGRERGIPVYEDLGSGCLADLGACGIDEPRPQESLRAGAHLVSFSGDKLAGGPQAGILAGEAELVARLRRNPMYRALRLDKLILEALATTLGHTLAQRWDAIPALRMITAPAAAVRLRAQRLAARLPAGFAAVEPARSVIGGGATPEQWVPSYAIAIAGGGGGGAALAMERALAAGDPPVIARIEDERLLVDLRTVFEEEEEPLLEALLKLAGAAV